MPTATPATAFTRRRDFAPRRTRVLTVRYQASPERSSPLDRPRHGPLHTAIVALATPLPASNESHLPAVLRLCFDARRATDAGSFKVFRRAPPIVVGRLPCNALSRIVAPRADRRVPPSSRFWTLARRRSSSAARPLARQPAVIDDCHASSRRSFITICDFSRSDAISDSRYSFHSDFTQSSKILVLPARRWTLKAFGTLVTHMDLSI